MGKKNTFSCKSHRHLPSRSPRPSWFRSGRHWLDHCSLVVRVRWGDTNVLCKVGSSMLVPTFKDFTNCRKAKIIKTLKVILTWSDFDLYLLYVYVFVFICQDTGLHCMSCFCLLKSNMPQEIFCTFYWCIIVSYNHAITPEHLGYFYFLVGVQIFCLFFRCFLEGIFQKLG